MLVTIMNTRQRKAAIKEAHRIHPGLAVDLETAQEELLGGTIAALELAREKGVIEAILTTTTGKKLVLQHGGGGWTNIRVNLPD